MKRAPNLLAVSEVARRLGCSRQHVYNLIAAGRLRSADIGLKEAATRVREDDLAAYIDASTRRAS